jgi:kynurenine 3-monooxygenase
MRCKGKKRAAIVGAGPVGCLAAEVLAARGFDVDVYDKRPTPTETAGGRSINLSITPRGIDILDRFGAGAAIRALSVPMTGRAFHPSDRDISIQSYGRPNWVTYSITRSELNQALLAFVQRRSDVRVHFGQACLHADLEPPTLILRSRDDRVKPVAADLIVGADGVASAVRSAVLRLPRTNFAKTVFPGIYRELTLRCASGGFPFYEHAIHIWPRGDFFMVALPNRDRTFRGTLVLPDERARRLGAAEAMHGFLETHFPDILPYLVETAAELLRGPAGEIVAVRCEALHHAGSVLLLGDAAHAVVPFMGQGVNMGLEDCGALAGHLDEHGSDLERAFAAMTEERLPEALACADLSEWNWNELTSGRPVTAAPAEDSLVSQVNFSGLSYRKVAERLIPNWRPRVVATAHGGSGERGLN